MRPVAQLVCACNKCMHVTPFNKALPNCWWSMLRSSALCGRWRSLSPEAQELVLGLLEYNPNKRLTAQQVSDFLLKHSSNDLDLTAAFAAHI